MSRRATGAVLLAACLAAAAPLLAQGRPPAPPAGVVTDEPPPATLLYQNFPNPFIVATHGHTCLWFDLAHDSAVRLEIVDIRGRAVRTILPAPGFTGIVPAGRYGRDAGAQCVEPLVWDGTDRDGRVVPNGIYLVRLVADGEHATRKIIVREH
jgi:hypothetical protein